MNKEEALKEIDRLKEYILNLDKVKKNIMSSRDLNFNNRHEVEINERWAFSIHADDGEGESYEGSKKTGQKSSLFLSNCYGTWHNMDGETVYGYLYFKPKEDN